MSQIITTSSLYYKESIAEISALLNIAVSPLRDRVGEYPGLWLILRIL